MTKMHNQSIPLKRLAGWLGVVGVSIAAGFPIVAQSQGVLNPRPSIFNEPPYNQTPGTTPGTTPPVAPAPVTPTPTAPAPVTPTPTTPPTGTSPDAANNIVALAAANSSFKTLTAALQAAGLTETLSGTGPFTVFAPTDEAFAALPQDALQELLRPENKQLLVQILTYHVVPARVQSTELQPGEVPTVEGEAINVKTSGNQVTVNDATVVQPDIQASNGIIHAIDRVLLPPNL
ncbi:fasciclin domain-containing protein [Gloeocapsopsis crepidinum LEGE 06123]|uniref:Fasciclin domain-containing protein n=1 Tax=Gloeocapsopsis crepidinum LEGE 06123 TaxID=588587 RepID=A0ABR9UXQ2_9CHRO|nr:fasciclin domain-containing protein [Gloeocapsopsis crepidinum]MBE9193079.1 fasciclin domain-containing protein [Gloeocapsopsis crepidinum LEGE 06123]